MTCVVIWSYPHKIDDLKMTITEQIRNVDRAILNTVFENTIWSVKTRIILLLTRIMSFHLYVLERYDICMIRAIPALRVTSNHAYVIPL